MVKFEWDGRIHQTRMLDKMQIICSHPQSPFTLAIFAAISRRVLNYWRFKSPRNRQYTGDLKSVQNRRKNRQCKQAIRSIIKEVRPVFQGVQSYINRTNSHKR